MTEAEIAELNRFVNKNIHICGPGCRWLMEWDELEPKPLSPLKLLEIAIDELKTKGITEKMFTAITKAGAFTKEYDEELYFEIVNEMKKASETPDQDTPEAQ